MSRAYLIRDRQTGDMVARPEVARVHPRQWPFTRFVADAEHFTTHGAAIRTRDHMRRQGHRDLIVAPTDQPLASAILAAGPL